jgi:polar amino acid transport system substrate-binding protein
MKKKLIICLIVCIYPTPAFSKKIFKAVYFSGFPPYSFEVEGQMRGILIDALNEAIGKRMKISIAHKGYPWARAQNEVQRGTADAFVTNPTPTRREYTEVSKEAVIRPEYKIFTRFDHPRISEIQTLRSFDQLVGFKAGTMIGNNLWKSMVEEKSIPVETEFVATLELVLKKISAGRNDLTVEAAEIIHYEIKKAGLVGRIIEMPHSLHQGNFVLCIGEQSPFVSVLPQFDAIIREMREDGTLQMIYEKYK